MVFELAMPWQNRLAFQYDEYKVPKLTKYRGSYSSCSSLQFPPVYNSKISPLCIPLLPVILNIFIRKNFQRVQFLHREKDCTAFENIGSFISWKWVLGGKNVMNESVYLHQIVQAWALIFCVQHGFVKRWVDFSLIVRKCIEL